jgi:hypothetical protein
LPWDPLLFCHPILFGQLLLFGHPILFGRLLLVGETIGFVF